MTVVDDGHRPIIGRDLFPQIGLPLTQTKQVANVDQNRCLINKTIHKNKYQMPNINNSIDTIQQNLNTNASHEKAYFSTLDLKYAYSQLNLHLETARHCNFNIISGEGTGTYRFITGFYGLTDMPTAFQKVMD